MLFPVDDDRVAKDDLVRMLLRQAFRQRLPDLAFVAGAINAKLAFAGKTLAVRLQRHDKGRAVIADRQTKTKI